MTKWGLSATIKATTGDTLAFAAYHLDQGAHRLYIYLDDANPEAYAHLKAHPKIRVATCDDTYWRKLNGKRPGKHQVRQTLNATHAYGRRIEVDWLIHMDVDEYLWPQTTIADSLDALDAGTLCARTRPIEALSGDGTHFKGFIPSDTNREYIVARLYPQFGPYLKGGFLSHLAGKLFVRTGLDDLSVRIHNVFQGEVCNPGETELPSVDLCHAHAKTWDDWIAAYRFRHEKGSYRAELAANRPVETGGMSMHDLFQMIEADSGESGLRMFFDEVSADTPKLRARLTAEGLLRVCELNLNQKTQKHFPDFG